MPDLSSPITAADLKRDGPTELTLSAIGEWVIWQFPRPRRGGLCAALHPPQAAAGWYPGIVHPDEERVEVHAHGGGPFATPEEALAWMEKA